MLTFNMKFKSHFQSPKINLHKLVLSEIKSHLENIEIKYARLFHCTYEKLLVMAPLPNDLPSFPCQLRTRPSVKFG